MSEPVKFKRWIWRIQYAWRRFSWFRRWMVFIKERQIARYPDKLPKPEDDRVPQRHRKKVALGFLGALDEVYGDFSAKLKTPRTRRRFSQWYGTIDVETSEPLLDFIEHHSDLDLRRYIPEAKQATDLGTINMTRMGSDPKGEWWIQSIRSVSPKVCSRLFPVVLPDALWLESRITLSSMPNRAVHCFYLSRDLENWSCCWTDARGKPQWKYPLPESEPDFELREFWDIIYLQVALMARSLDDVAWNLTMQRGPMAFLFRCTDSQAREFISLRDKEGRKCRASSRHWVTQHYRQTRTGITRVKAHLRGAQEFRWGEWYCHLTEAEFDQAAAETGLLPTANIQRRQWWRLSGQDEPSIPIN